MKDFARLLQDLGASTDSAEKIARLAHYFREADAADAVWALTLLCGSPPKRVMTTAHLRRVACEVAGIAAWLFEECRRTTGETAETIALLLPHGSSEDGRPLSEWIEEELLPLATCDDRQRASRLEVAWRRLDVGSRRVWNKLLTGSFRECVPQSLILRALGMAFGLPVAALARRSSKGWPRDRAGFERLIATVDEREAEDRPHAFCWARTWSGGHDASPLAPDRSRSPDEFLVEWKWDGMRAQAQRRSRHASLWSRDEELWDDRFPEIVEELKRFPEGTTLDGAVVPVRDGLPQPLTQLDERMTRKHVTRAVVEATPAAFVAFDILDDAGVDVRSRPLVERRGRLERLLERTSSAAIRLSERVQGQSWTELDDLRRGSRDRGVAGLMLKRKDSPYVAECEQEGWWKWNVDPHAVQAVLVYAQAGVGRHSDLFADYSFAVWSNGELVPFARASTGLTDAEFAEVDALVKQAAVKKFGPVRAVRPELVFEIAFDGLFRSERHKSGFTVRNPRILGWRRDKNIADADTLERVLSLLPTNSSPPSRTGNARTKQTQPPPRQLRLAWPDSDP